MGVSWWNERAACIYVGLDNNAKKHKYKVELPREEPKQKTGKKKKNILENRDSFRSGAGETHVYILHSRVLTLWLGYIRITDGKLLILPL